MPDPLTIEKNFNKSVSELRDKGFTGDNVVMAGHSLGAAVMQDLPLNNPQLVKAQILMAANLRLKNIHINDQGKSELDWKIPSLTIFGDTDGLERISRAVVSQWHQIDNIDPSQAGQFPVVVLNGVAHHSFMGDAPYPAFV